MPPSVSFLDALALGLIDATDARNHPQALADALIFTPNRRAARELALALYRAMGSTLLVPTIRALGDIEAEDAATAFGADALDLPPALPAARRRGALAKLIQRWREVRFDPPLPPASALAAADELAGLLDQAAISGGAAWEGLKYITREMEGTDLAEHWRVSADFLEIVATHWPAYLEEQKAADPLTRRRLAAEATVERWQKRPPKHPVIIAGSTGAASATRIMMKTVMTLPQGVIVFPGLDPDLEPAGWKAVSDAPSHPQFTLFETLRAIGVETEEVRDWPGSVETANARARRRLVNEALAPAEATKGWNDRLRHLAKPDSAESLVRAGLSGLTLIEAEDESEEALVAALLLRETLETEGLTAALVTPEAVVGRRVAAILERWGVDVAPSAGAPFSRSRAGSFLLLAMNWARDPADPAMLLALLKHPLCAVNRTPDELRRLTSRLERVALRGPRLDRTLADMRRRLEALKHPEPEAAQLIADLDKLLAPFAAVFAEHAIDGAKAATACAELSQQLAASPASPKGDRLWAGRSGAMAVQFVEQLAQLCAEMGPVEASLWPEFATSVARGLTPAPDAPEHPRLSIWGPLEARLQRRDRMILAGLNEGAWPKPAPADAFLNRALRRKIGLSDPDERIGLSAHDFAQMANAPEVVLLRARRVDDKPAVASRWLWRLRTLSAGGLGETDTAEAELRPKPGRDALAWARALRRAGNVTPIAPPAPKPTIRQRGLTAMSPSRAVDLIRDPYADFAKRILRLERLRAVGEEIDARERGKAVHKAVEIYANDQSRALDDLIVERLLLAGASPELIELERPLWVRAAKAWLRWADARAPFVADVDLEQKSTIRFVSGAEEVELSATADRVELLTDGTLAIIDFKTGQPKTWKQVLSGLEPQLALEAAIGARAGFGKLKPASASQLIYFQMSTGAATDKKKNGQPLQFEDAAKQDVPTMTVAEDALAGLIRLVGKFAQPEQPYLSRPRVFSVKVFSDYDRLARRDEWTIEEGEE
jgi:ATP-dependent helicase/nuclease subunit B